MLRTAFKIVLTVVAVATTGACGEGTTAVEPELSEAGPGEATYGPGPARTSGLDVVWGANGVAQWTDNGVTWKMQRYGSYTAPYRVKMWKNGALEGTMNLIWSGSTLVKIRWTPAGESEWVETTAGGIVLGSSVPPSGGGGGGGGGGGPLLAGADIPPECGSAAGNFGIFATASGIAWAAVAAGGFVSAITKAPMAVAWTRGAGSLAIGASLAAYASAANLFDCLI